MQAIINWFAETNVQAAIIGPFLSAILTAITYCFNQNTQKKITISNLIQDIERLSTEHWCSPASDEINRARCIEILHKFKTLGWKMDQKKEYKKQALIKYRKAVTGGDFDSPQRIVTHYDSEKVKNISSAARNLRRDLGIKKHH